MFTSQAKSIFGCGGGFEGKEETQPTILEGEKTYNVAAPMTVNLSSPGGTSIIVLSQ